MEDDKIDYRAEFARGWNWLVRNRAGRPVCGGWSAGKRRDAEDDATAAIVRLVAQRRAA